MLRTYTRNDNRLVPIDDAVAGSAALWIDLLEPNTEDVQAVQKLLDIDVPTRAEMEEIELSARLYREDGATYLTQTAVAQLDTEQPIKTPITFILKNDTLVTVRYAEPKPITMFLHRALRPNGMPYSRAEDIMLSLIEAMIDRIADALERVGNETDGISREVFRQGRVRADKKTQNLEGLIRRIGGQSELLTMLQESLVSSSRLVSYFGATETAGADSADTRYLVKVVNRDATSLGDHALSLSNRLTFLLDATLGLINLEQNQIIKIFSVAAVMFLPATLVASIYGMNFIHMPELEWTFGYPFALGLMVLSAVVPFLYFKRKGWL